MGVNPLNMKFQMQVPTLSPEVVLFVSAENNEVHDT